MDGTPYQAFFARPTNLYHSRYEAMPAGWYGENATLQGRQGRRRGPAFDTILSRSLLRD